MNWFKEIELQGNQISLLPLKKEHREALLEAAGDGQLWELWYTSVPSEATIDQYINTALEEQSNGLSLPFVIVQNETKKIIGSTRFCNAEPKHKRLEIGYTWYAKSVHRTGVNTEAKYLLLRHAFETLNTIAVEFRTNSHNRASRRAISRLGAKQDGLLRNHRIDHNGLKRDTVVFSILENEWNTVKYALEFEMNRKR
ncbi:MAG: GNAT family N-acetyltransferase [Saprospiraceae bacterium]